jgi:hypothetical protein
VPLYDYAKSGNKMMPVLEWIKLHFQNYRKRSKWSFLWRISAEGILVSLAMAIALKLVFSFPPRHDLHPGIKGIVSVVVLAPFLETLLSQSFPVMISRVLGFGFRGQLLAAWLPFAALHFLVSIDTGICAGIVGGFYIGFTYAQWRQVSLRSAFWMTCATHTLHNAPFAAAMFLVHLKR